MHRLTKASLDALASPSLSMEKGAYRMRAPRTRRLTSLARPAPNVNPAYRGMTLCTALLIVCLATAALSSFGTAYYLWTTRWDTRAVPHVLSEADQGIQAIRLEHDSNGDLTVNV